ncbi:MAG: 3'-5' exonuclease [Proteobacteria bacterium]|nr:3'-5' exonuclease [Pseudomonadota bacterium]
MIIIYDTETTGLPLWGEPSEHPDQPRIVQLAALLTDGDGSKQASMDLLIRPDGFTIPKEATEIHGITTEQASACGVPIVDALTVFFGLWRCADLRIGHGQSFDERMVRIEMKRPGAQGFGLAPDDWKAGQTYCTMNKSKPILELPPTDKMIAAGRRGFKVPKLSEAYEHFIGKAMVDAHDAMGDVIATLAVYLKLKEQAA